jgi:uncharacterized protein
MSAFYREGSRELQDRFDTRRLADRLEQRLVVDRIGDADKAFIESLDMFFLATTDGAGQPSCSYKGGEAGFVKVVDAATLAFPNYDGNGMFLSMGNIAHQPLIGMLCSSISSGNAACVSRGGHASPTMTISCRATRKPSSSCGWR